MTESKKGAAKAPAKPKAAAKKSAPKKKKVQLNRGNSRQWHLVDAEGQVLGRMASRIAVLLRGKNKVSFAPHSDEGDFVICINAAKVKLTGRKMEDKFYFRHSGYYGGLKQFNATQMLKREPGELVRQAVRGMLPKNRLGRAMIGKLKIYPGAEHPHLAQKPQTLNLNETRK